MLFANSTSLLWLSYFTAVVELLRSVAVSDCRGLLCVYFPASLAALSDDVGCRWSDMDTRQFPVAVD